VVHGNEADTMNERVTDLEINVTHLQRTVQELHEVVWRQQQTIDVLVEELQAMKSQYLQAFPSPVKEPEQEEPPPHY
jgi:uncharacterized coiled-coil protein SlyX